MRRHHIRMGLAAVLLVVTFVAGVFVGLVLGVDVMLDGPGR